MAVARPLAARAQQPERTRRIGVLAGYDDPNMKAFQRELARLGWSDGGNVHIEYRYAPAGSHVHALAKELVALQPDVIFAQSRPVVAALQAESRAIPIVFTAVIDPIGAGFIASLARPGGNITGFMVYEPSVVGKWLAMLKEIAPHLARAALVGNPKTAVYYDYLVRAAEAAAPSLGIELVPAASRTLLPTSSAPWQPLLACPTAAWSCCQIVRQASTAISSPRLRPATTCRRSIAIASLSTRAVSCPTGSSLSTNIARRRPTSTASCVAPSLPTCRCRLRRSMKRSSTSKLRSRSALPCRPACSSL